METPEERLATAMERIATVAEKWFDKQYPEKIYEEEPEITRVGDAPKEPKSQEDYEAFPVDGPGRFEQLLKKVQGS
jgi:hypothetical protein